MRSRDLLITCQPPAPPSANLAEGEPYPDCCQSAYFLHRISEAIRNGTMREPAAELGERWPDDEGGGS